jgi:hypothetical protein
VAELNQDFKQSLELEFQRNFDVVNATLGWLEIFPEIAQNLPETKHALSAHLCYDNDIIRTQNAFPSHHLSGDHFPPHSATVGSAGGGGVGATYQWSQSHLDSDGERNQKKFCCGGEQKFQSLPEMVPYFEVDTLNIRGNITLIIYEDRFPYQVEYASVDIPIFHLLEYLDKMRSEEGYCRWFPLELSKESSFVTRNGTGSDGSGTQRTRRNSLSSLTPDPHLPSICLSLKWSSPKTTSLLSSSTAAAKKKSISKYYCRVQVPFVSLSLLDSIRIREIMHITLSGIEGRYSESEQSTNQSLHVTWFQVDNQFYSSASTSIITPSCLTHPQPSLRLYICKNNHLSVETTPAYDKMEFILQEIDMTLEQQVVASIWEIEQIMRREKLLFYRTSNYSDVQEGGGERKEEEEGNEFIKRRKNQTGNSSQHQPFTPTLRGDDDSPPNVTNTIHTQMDDLDKKLYVEHFYISPVVINISFLTSSKSSYSQSILTEALSERSTITSSSSSSTSSGSASSKNPNSSLQLFLWQVGEVILELTSNISDASMKFNGLSIDHMFKTSHDITSTLREHYLNSALGQIYRIVGSLDLVNNPVGLLSSLGTGVRDFFYEPAHALISHPTEFRKIGKGVVKGAVSFASNTADGIIGTTTVMTRSVGRGIAFFAKDEVFLFNREKLNEFPETICGHVARPFRDVGNGVICGVLGVVRLPYQDTRKYGCPGFLTGLGKGLTGLGAKPVIGVLDAITHTGEGIRAIVKSIQKRKEIAIQRNRYPSLFGIDGRLLPYTESSALGAYLLYLVDSHSKDQARQETFRQKFHEALSAATGESQEDNLSSSFVKSWRRQQRWDGTAAAVTSVENGGNWPLMKTKRRRSILDRSSETISLEGVVYTTHIRHTAIVVTTKRVIIVTYDAVEEGGRGHEVKVKVKRSHAPEILWQCSLQDLDTALSHQPASGEGGEDREVEGVTSLTVTNQRNGRSYVIESENVMACHLILELSLVLDIMLHQYDPSSPAFQHPRIIPHHADGGDYVTLDSWQYTLPPRSNSSHLLHGHDLSPFPLQTSPSSLLEERNGHSLDTMIVNNLENSSWKIEEILPMTIGDPEDGTDSCARSSGSNKRTMPKWLLQDKKFVIDSHQSIHALLEMCRNNTTHHAIIRSLLDGCMTSEEFRIFIEKDARYGSAIHQTDDNSSHSNPNRHPSHHLSHRTGGGGGGGKNSNSNSNSNQYSSVTTAGSTATNLGKVLDKVEKRIRNSVTSFPFFKQRSDSQISELSSTVISHSAAGAGGSYPSTQQQPQSNPFRVRESPKLIGESFHLSSNESKHSVIEEEEQERSVEWSRQQEQQSDFVREKEEESSISPQLENFRPLFMEADVPSPHGEVEMKETPKTAQNKGSEERLPRIPPPGPSLGELLEKIQRVENLMTMLTRSVSSPPPHSLHLMTYPPSSTARLKEQPS